ncbi:MAG: hypothetical protein ISS46_02285 [Candidatus Omnitrophica bacterium]|nr:hypothetical protein [Candidatus Omnitrophota bacterium]
MEKRLNFALKITSGEIPLKLASGDLYANFSKLEQVIRAFLDSLEWKDGILSEFMDNISGGNIRLALDLVKSFLGSGHVDTEKITKIYEDTKHYIVPLHEFLRAVMHGDNAYFDAESSYIANIYDISTTDEKEYFLLPILVALLINLGESGRHESGFVETTELYDKVQGLGYTPEQIDVAITRAIKKRLVESSARRIPEPGQTLPQALRVTTVGSYHLTRLSRYFPYVDAIIVDTPILDSDVRENIKNVENIHDRLSRAGILRNYFDNIWNRANIPTTIFDWKQVSEELKAGIGKIEKKCETPKV